MQISYQEVFHIRYKSTSYKSKWLKTKWLISDSRLKAYVPKTLLFSKGNLEIMLNSFKTVYFKPTDGSGGAKIVKIQKRNHTYNAKHCITNKNFSSQHELYRWMKSFAGQRSFILQKGIALAKTDGKPFDIRVMVQKSNEGTWKTTAIFCKVGRPGKVATNYNQGGHLQFIGPTLANAGYGKETQETIQSELRQMGTSVAHVFSRYSKGFKELGLDVAIDQQGRLWILEVNTRPQFYPLKNMSNKALYSKILKYAKQYGRTK